MIYSTSLSHFCLEAFPDALLPVWSSLSTLSRCKSRLLENWFPREKVLVFQPVHSLLLKTLFLKKVSLVSTKDSMLLCWDKSPTALPVLVSLDLFLIVIKQNINATWPSVKRHCSLPSLVSLDALLAILLMFLWLDAKEILFCLSINAETIKTLVMHCQEWWKKKVSYLFGRVQFLPFAEPSLWTWVCSPLMIRSRKSSTNNRELKTLCQLRLSLLLLLVLCAQLCHCLSIMPRLNYKEWRLALMAKLLTRISLIAWEKLLLKKVLLVSGSDYLLISLEFLLTQSPLCSFKTSSTIHSQRRLIDL